GAAKRAELLEEPGIGPLRQSAGLAVTLHLTTTNGPDGTDEPHLLLALHHRPRCRVQLQDRELSLGLSQHPLIEELIHPVAQVGLLRLVEEAVRREFCGPTQRN